MTNTAAVGGAGVNLALKLLNGETVEADTAGDRSRTPSCSSRSSPTTRPTPARPLLESWQVDGLDPLWPLGLQIEGYTTYTPSRPSPARARASSPHSESYRGGMPASPAPPVRQPQEDR